MSNRMIYHEKDYNEHFKKYNVEPRIISDGDTFDCNYGTDYALLTDEDIKAIQEGKALYIDINSGEYCCLLKKEVQRMTGEEKQKAIDALKISAPVMAMTQEEFYDYIQTLNKIMDWIEQDTVSKESYDHEYFLRKELEIEIAKLKQQESKWIPVKDKLPEEDGRFLTYIEHPRNSQLSYIMTCDYINQTWCPDDDTASDNVVAWMSLPEPYKED